MGRRRHLGHVTASQLLPSAALVLSLPCLILDARFEKVREGGVATKNQIYGLGFGGLEIPALTRRRRRICQSLVNHIIVSKILFLQSPFVIMM